MAKVIGYVTISRANLEDMCWRAKNGIERKKQERILEAVEEYLDKFHKQSWLSKFLGIAPKQFKDINEVLQDMRRCSDWSWGFKYCELMDYQRELLLDIEALEIATNTTQEDVLVEAGLAAKIWKWGNKA